MSGPPKTPPRLHLIRGNPSKRPVKDHKKTAKKDEKGLPKIPQHLGAQGKYWFRRMAEELNAEGIISQLDARALELLVEAYTEYLKLWDRLLIMVKSCKVRPLTATSYAKKLAILMLTTPP